MRTTGLSLLQFPVKCWVKLAAAQRWRGLPSTQALSGSAVRLLRWLCAGCDVLWGGCPIVTLPLERMASRVAASLCYATGLGSEMVVSSQQVQPLCGGNETALRVVQEILCELGISKSLGQCLGALEHRKPSLPGTLACAGTTLARKIDEEQ